MLNCFFFGFYRCRRGKVLLLGSLVCWILFTIPLSFIKPEPVKCLERNETDFILTYTRTKRDLSAVNFNNPLSETENLWNNQAAISATLKPMSMQATGQPEVTHKR